MKDILPLNIFVGHVSEYEIANFVSFSFCYQREIFMRSSLRINKLVKFYFDLGEGGS